MHGSGISIWFFIGVSLLVNGALITAAGIYELSHPPQFQVVLYQYHSNIWWGAALFVFGLIYVIKFWPHRAHSA